MLNSKIVCFTQARDFGIAVNVFWKELPKKFYDPKERLAYVGIHYRPRFNPKPAKFKPQISGCQIFYSCLCNIFFENPR